MGIHITIISMWSRKTTQKWGTANDQLWLSQQGRCPRGAEPTQGNPLCNMSSIWGFFFRGPGQSPVYSSPHDAVPIFS